MNVGYVEYGRMFGWRRFRNEYFPLENVNEKREARNIVLMGNGLAQSIFWEMELKRTAG